jgi:hypothetical protein
MNWQSRPDFNWCYNCWFNAKIESKTTEIGETFVCLHCGYSARHYHNEPRDKDCPRYFTDEEWSKFWTENYKIKE